MSSSTTTSPRNRANSSPFSSPRDRFSNQNSPRRMRKDSLSPRLREKRPDPIITKFADLESKQASGMDDAMVSHVDTSMESVDLASEPDTISNPNIQTNSSLVSVGITPLPDSLKNQFWEVENDISYVVDRVYLGTYRGSLDRKALLDTGISHIVQAIEVEENPYGSDFVYLNVNVSDTKEEDLEQYFDVVADFVQNALRESETNKVFLHCGSGISRSAALIIAYLMKYEQKFNHSFRRAYDYLKKMRIQVKPNRGFKQQLQSYEVKLNSKNNKVPLLPLY
jgi:protein-tyrosine phosphatase